MISSCVFLKCGQMNKKTKKKWKLKETKYLKVKL